MDRPGIDPKLQAAHSIAADALEAHWRAQSERLRRQALLLETEVPFSLSRALQNAEHGGQHHGADLEYLTETARLQGTAFDPQRLVVPRRHLQRDLTAGSAGGGGYLVGTETTGARDTLAPGSFLRLCTIVDGLRGNVVVPRTAGDPTLHWATTEATAATPSTPTLGGSALTPKQGTAVISFGRQWHLQTGPAGDAWIGELLRRMEQQTMETAVAAGTGAAGQPLGIVNAAGVAAVAGASLDWSDVLDMEATAAGKGASDGSVAFLAPPPTRKVLKGRDRGGGTGFIWEGSSVAGNPAYAATTLPAQTLICGPLREVLIGLWGVGPTVEINPYASFQTGGRAIRLCISMDVAIVGDPGAFSVATGVT